MIVSFSEVLCCCLKRKYILSFCMLTSHGLPSLVVSCVVWKSHKPLWAWARPWTHPSKQGQAIGFWQPLVGLVLVCPPRLVPLSWISSGENWIATGEEWFAHHFPFPRSLCSGCSVRANRSAPAVPCMFPKKCWSPVRVPLLHPSAGRLLLLPLSPLLSKLFGAVIILSYICIAIPTVGFGSGQCL